jgi:serine phosphatase RsbU (regulator of sigma subunit)
MSWIKTIEFISFYLAIATSCLFVCKLFPQESNKIIFFMLNIPVIIVSIITIFTPPIIFTFLIKIVQIDSFIIFIYVTYVNIIAVMRNREGAVAHFIGIFTVTIFASNDILYSMGFITSKHLTPYGILVMIICQAYVLSTKFSRAFSTVEKLSSSLETKNFELEDLNQNLEKKINERTQELTTARNRLWAEMEVAKKIQTVLLPKKPVIPGFQIATYMLPTKEVGGDYFDIINTDENDWIMIGDVSGHGVPAGLVMMMAQSIIRSHVMSNPTIKPSELLGNINLAIGYNLKNMNEQKFMTISALLYDKKNKIIFSGRHEDILIYRKESEQVEVVKTAGICISPMSLGEKNKNLELQINQGDIILLYTDGIIEAWLGKEESVNRENMFGQEKLVSILNKTGSLSPEEIKKRLLDELENYTIDDDVTFLIIKKS